MRFQIRNNEFGIVRIDEKRMAAGRKNIAITFRERIYQTSSRRIYSFEEP